MKHLECLPKIALLRQRCNENSTQTEGTSAESESRDVAAAPASDWIYLLNCNNLDSWHSYNETAPRPAWKIEDGVIVLHDDNASDE